MRDNGDPRSILPPGIQSPPPPPPHHFGLVPELPFASPHHAPLLLFSPNPNHSPHHGPRFSFTPILRYSFSLPLPLSRVSIPLISPFSPPISPDLRSKWKKRKRESLLKRHKPQDDDEDEEDDDEDPAVAPAADDEENDDDPAANHNHDPVLDLRESEILSDGGGVRISDFPLAVRRLVNRPHPSVLALAAADRACQSSRPWTRPVLENISHGQLQTLSAVLPDNPSLYPPSDVEKPSAYVCTPPPLMEGKGVAKQLPDGRHLLVPMHGSLFLYLVSDSSSNFFFLIYD